MFKSNNPFDLGRKGKFGRVKVNARMNVLSVVGRGGGVNRSGFEPSVEHDGKRLRQRISISGKGRVSVIGSSQREVE